MPKMNDREYRSMFLDTEPKSEKRFDTEFYVEGYAARFDAYPLYEDDGQTIYERFERGCFEGCDMSDVILQYNHIGHVYARQRNNTLAVEVDDNGLKIYADLGKSQASRDLYEEIKNGLTDRMSWGFIPLEYRYDKDTHTIVHTKVKKIFDVSAVSIPANDTTDIHSVRSFVDGEIDKEIQELKRNAETKARLALKLKLMEV